MHGRGVYPQLCVIVLILSSKTMKRGLLERLEEGVVIGDGSYLIALEKRGYVTAGRWTPEAVIRYPAEVAQMHRAYLRAGADVLTTFTFFSSDDKLSYKGDSDTADPSNQDDTINARSLNLKACDLAKQVASEGDALVAGGFSPVVNFSKEDKESARREFRKQAAVFKEKDVDFLLGEFFGTIEEAEVAVDVMKTLDKPVACTMRIAPIGDEGGVLPQECAVRLPEQIISCLKCCCSLTGADVVGVNCMYDPTICLKTMALMKRGLEAAGLKAHLIAQPVGYHTQEIENEPRGYIMLPEFPFAMEPRLLTRMDAGSFAREAYKLGVRYIGGCCGYEPYHIRAMAEELTPERGRGVPGADNSEGFASLKRSLAKEQRDRANAEYWKELVPAAGRQINLLSSGQ